MVINFIQGINHHPLHKNCLNLYTVIYPIDGAIQPLHNWGKIQKCNIHSSS